MELRDGMTFHAFHLMFFPVDIRLISPNSPKIFHAHTSAMAAITRLVHRRTFKKLVSSKETTSSRSLPEDMATPTRCMTLKARLINSRFHGCPFLACPLAHHCISPPKCGMKTCPKGLNNFLMTGNAKTLHLCGSCPFSLMSHLFITCLIIPSMTFHTTKLPVRGL
jgi:hypothetical protein